MIDPVTPLNVLRWEMAAFYGWLPFTVDAMERIRGGKIRDVRRMFRKMLRHSRRNICRGGDGLEYALNDRRTELRMITLLDAIIRIDILALQSCDVGRLASAVRDDLSALPALLDALEEAGRDDDRRMVAVLGDTGVIAREVSG